MDFILRRPIVDFSRGSPIYLSREAISGENSLYPLEIKKSIFFLKCIGKCQISKSRGA